MKVSIIIPIYNVSRYIARCLSSALAQTWEDLEIILVNDCTPDDSIDVIKQVLAESSRKEIVTLLEHSETRGPSAGRNTGIRKASGDYVFFLDSDDYLPPNGIELLAQTVLDDQADFVVGNYKVTGNSRWSPPMSLKSGLLASNERILSTYAKGQWYVMVWNKLVKRSFIYEENLFFQEGIIHEDDLWSFMMASKAQKAYVVNQVTYYYYTHSNSIMGNPSQRNLDCRVRVIRYLFDYIQTSSSLRENRHVYVLFETLKNKYFDRILYFAKDPDFIYSSYLSLRSCTYISFFQAFVKFKPSFVLCMTKLHEEMPQRIGYIYWRSFLRFLYYKMIVGIKLKRGLGKKQ